MFRGPVDWAATGSMLSGIGTVVGALAIVGAAFVGRQVARDVRRDRHAEREMEHAEHILTVAYRLKDVISAIRNPMSTGQELAESKGELKETGSLDSLTEAKRKKLIQANVFYLRAKRQNALLDEAYGLLPVAKAFFGAETSDALFEFMRARHAVLVYAQAYADDAGQDLSHTRTIERTIWEGWGDKDEIASKLEQSINTLEGVLLPIIRPGSKTDASAVATAEPVSTAD